MKRYVLTHPQMGIYLGSAMGLGFWSKWDTVGQDCAVTFASPEEINRVVETWDDPTPGREGRAVAVEVARQGERDFEQKVGDHWYATIAECVAAGLEAWDPGPYARGRT